MQKHHWQLLISIFLFLLTFCAATWSQIGLDERFSLTQQLQIIAQYPQLLIHPLIFATALMLILLAHEIGHYLTARYYNVRQSPPFFIPAPNLFGTLGAVIFMNEPPPNRRVLCDIAVMGPYLGLLVAIPAACLGLAYSQSMPPSQLTGSFTAFGSSLLFRGLEMLFIPQGHEALLHPLALAGWVGMFVTSLNLIPAGQLDGGHVIYAIFPKQHRQISTAIIISLLFFSLFAHVFWQVKLAHVAVWIFWAFLLFIMGNRHPEVRFADLPPARRQKIHAIAALLLFILTFVPVPISVVNFPEKSPRPLPQTEPQEAYPHDDNGIEI